MIFDVIEAFPQERIVTYRLKSFVSKNNFTYMEYIFPHKYYRKEITKDEQLHMSSSPITTTELLSISNSYFMIQVSFNYFLIISFSLI